MAPGRPRPAHATGVQRFPSDDTIRNFFLRFSQAHVEAFWRSLWRWLVRLVKCPTAGFTLDLDSTVFCCKGKQEGALKGFNPKRKGRNSHHPLLAVLAEAPFILHLAAQREHGRGPRSGAVLAGGPRAFDRGGCGCARCGPTAVSSTVPSRIFWRNAACRMWWWRA